MLLSVRVLVIEDKAETARLIRAGLVAEGMLADVAATGEDALWMAEASPYAVICLDVALPGINGFEVCRRLRASGVETPVLMLTARDAIDDRVTGLEIGADDYLVKPFDLQELVARIRALARRPAARDGVLLEAGDLTLDPATRRVHRDGTEVELTVKEFQLLEVFMRRPDQVLSRFDLLEGAWDAESEHGSNIVDVHVARLRKKIDRPFGRKSIETVRGAGYRLRTT